MLKGWSKINAIQCKFLVKIIFQKGFQFCPILYHTNNSLILHTTSTKSNQMHWKNKPIAKDWNCNSSLLIQKKLNQELSFFKLLSFGVPFSTSMLTCMTFEPKKCGRNPHVDRDRSGLNIFWILDKCGISGLFTEEHKSNRT